MLSETCDPPKPRRIVVIAGNAFATSQYLMLELPTKSVAAAGGGDARSSASNAAMSCANRAGFGLACAANVTAPSASRLAAIRILISSSNRRFIRNAASFETLGSDDASWQQRIQVHRQIVDRRLARLVDVLGA